MKRIIIACAALALAVVPAVVGLWGNASFSAAVPVRVPASGQVITPSPTPSPSSSASPSPSATRSPSPSVDDHGGDTPRDQRTEPGDDRRVNGSGGSGGSARDDSAHRSGRGGHGSDDRGSDDRGSGGHGSDDRGSDDRGSGGHGSDDRGSDDHGGDR